MKFLRIVLAIMILTAVIAPAVVSAAEFQEVTVIATPKVSGGIISFTITYISETEIRFDWVLAGTADRIMIRASYNDYPADIPDAFTTPTDGYLVYYGDGIGTTNISDTSVNFDTNMGILYVKAWAQKNDDTWFTDTSTGEKESEIVTLILLFGFGLVVSAFAVLKKNTVIGIIASGIWSGVIAYTRSNPIGNMTTGDTADTAILVSLIGLMLLVPIISWRLGRKDEIIEQREEQRRNPPDRTVRLRDISSTRTRPESDDEYYDRLTRAVRPRR